MSACRAISVLFVAAVVAGCVHPRGVDVGVRASGEIAPGVYGRVDVRNRPPPLVLYPQPVIIVQQQRRPAPIYLHVPPGHARNWSKHCHKYDACATPVYFVKSREYEPGYQRPRGSRGRDDDDDDDDRRYRRR
jgi:hypothetical protein